MHAVILAAGRGSRMGEVTADQPKCLIELAGKPLLRWQEEALRAAGVTQIGVVRGYRAEQIVLPGATFFENSQWEQTGMVRSLLCAEEWLRKELCLVAYGDIVYHADVARMLLRMHHPIAIAYDLLWRELWESRFSDPLADAETFRVDEYGYLQEIGRRPRSLWEVEGQYMGLLRFTPNGWDSLRNVLDRLSPEEIDRLDMTSLLRQALSAGVRIGTAPQYGRWVEADSASDLLLYRQQIDQGTPWSHDWRPGETIDALPEQIAA